MFQSDRANITCLYKKGHTNQKSSKTRVTHFLIVQLLLLVQPTYCVSFFKPLRNKMGQVISNSQWYLYGKRHFTQTGYLRHMKEYYTDPVQASAAIGINQTGADGVSLNNKVVVVTGANSGMGKEVATYAAAKGAKLYMICRSEARAKTAQEEIVKTTENDNVKVILADVGELTDVRKAASELQSAESKIDVLVCNAGALVDERKETKEGYEVTFASHFLGGSYLLSELLLPQLKAAGDGRVIFVSSGGMIPEKFPTWETAINADGSAFDGFKQYSYAKRGQVILAEENTKIHPEVAWVSCHPGWASTPGVDETFGDTQKYLEPLRNGWQGAEGICWLMATDRKNLESGAFYLDRKPQRKHISGPFFTEGTRTKNTPEEVDDMMANLKKAAGL